MNFPVPDERHRNGTPTLGRTPALDPEFDPALPREVEYRR